MTKKLRGKPVDLRTTLLLRKSCRKPARAFLSTSKACTHQVPISHWTRALPWGRFKHTNELASGSTGAYKTRQHFGYLQSLASYNTHGTLNHKATELRIKATETDTGVSFARPTPLDARDSWARSWRMEEEVARALGRKAKGNRGERPKHNCRR